MSKFNDISLKIKTVSEKALKGYKFYTDKTNFQLVEATTVAEALEKSGVKNPVKIEVAGVITKSIFNQGELAEMQQKAGEKTPDATPAVPTVPEAKNPETPTNPA